MDTDITNSDDPIEKSIQWRLCFFPQWFHSRSKYMYVLYFNSVTLSCFGRKSSKLKLERFLLQPKRKIFPLEQILLSKKKKRDSCMIRIVRRFPQVDIEFERDLSSKPKDNRNKQSILHWLTIHLPLEKTLCLKLKNYNCKPFMEEIHLQ